MLNLITGGAGFIGSHLARLLVEQGEQVRVLDLKKPGFPLPGVEYRQGSITDQSVVRAATAGCGRVFHMAALAGLWAPDKRAFVTVNGRGTRKVLAAARAEGVETVVHTSTESILIDVRAGRKRCQLIDEDTELGAEAMAGPYCEGKRVAEATALRAWHRHGQRVIVCNPTVPMGPGDPWLTPPSRMLLGFLNRRFPACLATTLHMVDARDVALGHWLAARHGEPGRRYILGGHDMELTELLQLLERLSGIVMPRRRVPYALAYTVAAIQEFIADRFTGRPPSAPLTGVRLAGARVKFDNRRTRVTLGWTPRPVEETLIDALADYRARGLVTAWL